MSPEIMLMRIVDRANYWEEKAQSEMVEGRMVNANDFEQRSKALWALYESLLDEIKNAHREG